MVQTVLKKHMVVATDISEELYFQGQESRLVYVLAWATLDGCLEIFKLASVLIQVHAHTDTIYFTH